MPYSIWIKESCRLEVSPPLSAVFNFLDIALVMMRLLELEQLHIGCNEPIWWWSYTMARSSSTWWKSCGWLNSYLHKYWSMHMDPEQIMIRCPVKCSKFQESSPNQHVTRWHQETWKQSPHQHCYGLEAKGPYHCFFRVLKKMHAIFILNKVETRIPC